MQAAPSITASTAHKPRLGVQDRDSETTAPAKQAMGRAASAMKPLAYLTYRSLTQGRHANVELVHSVPQELKKEVEDRKAEKRTDLDYAFKKLAFSNNDTPDKPVPPSVFPSENSIVRCCQPSPLMCNKECSFVKCADETMVPEYRILAKMNNSFITKLEDFSFIPAREEGGLIVLSLITKAGNCTLKDVAAEAGRKCLPPRIVARIMGEILQGVEYLHNLKITHNDLKPLNILLMPDMHIKIIDMGSALEFDNSGELISDTSGVFNTNQYNAPEIVSLCEDDVCFSMLKKQDMWSIGCIFYELITGHALMQGAKSTGPVPERYFLDIERKINEITESLDDWLPSEIDAVQTALHELLHLDSDFRGTEKLRTFFNIYTPKQAEVDLNNLNGSTMC